MAPLVPKVREASDRSLLVAPPPRISAAFGDMVEHLLVGDFLAVSHGAEVFNLDAVLAPDVLVSPYLELHHFWVFSPDGIGSPDVGGGDTVKRKAAGNDHVQHFETVLATADPGDVLELLGGDVGLPIHSRHLPPAKAGPPGSP